jgi:hypothetical protein
MENASAVIFDGGGVFDQQRLTCLSDRASLLTCARTIHLTFTGLQGGAISFLTKRITSDTKVNFKPLLLA